MNKRMGKFLFFAFTVSIVLLCVYIMISYAGFDHETEKAKNMLVTVVIVMFFKSVIAEPIRFILVSIDMAYWPRSIPKQCKDDMEDDKDYNRLNSLKQQLQSLRVEMLMSERYRNESLNHEYKNIIQDLILYGKYFFVLTAMVLVSRNELLYHNTARLQTLFMDNHTDYIGLKEVYHLNQLFDYVESSLVDAFNYDTSEAGVSSWIHSEQNKLLGVVRMRQLRLEKEQFGWRDPVFSDMKYMPNWELPFQRLHYTEKYWRVYEPFMPITENYEFLDALLLNFKHVGKFQQYPELSGYISLLARSKQNTMKILDFLTEYHWLTYNTSAVFLDFTLYNVDANMFSVCTLRLEKTPFGGIIPDVDCDSVVLTDELEQQSYVSLMVLIIYIIVVLQFMQSFIVHLWYEPAKIRSMWFKLDLVIVVLNMTVIILVVSQATLVASMLRRLEGANKLDFVDFRRPARIHKLATILIGFMISATTLRLWKVLQFSKTFQLFTKTLYLAWKALATTALVIIIILISFGIALATINGNNSEHFQRLIKSMITAMCFSFGFSSEIKPRDLFHGGKYLGIVMYAVLGFVLSVLLINVFITTINDYFTVARAEREAKSDRQITFFQFLRVEYNQIFRIIQKLPCFKKDYKRNNRTVAENIQNTLEKHRKLEIVKARMTASILSAGTKGAGPPKDEETLQAEYRERVEHVYAIKNILNVQMEILERMLFKTAPKRDSSARKHEEDHKNERDDKDGKDDKDKPDKPDEPEKPYKRDEPEKPSEPEKPYEPEPDDENTKGVQTQKYRKSKKDQKDAKDEPDEENTKGVQTDKYKKTKKDQKDDKY